MAFSNPEQDSGDVLSEINMVPLIDIMLVLLIIFIITVPVIKHAVNIELPQASTEQEKIEPETISLSIDQDGQLFIDNKPMTDEQLLAHFRQAATKEPEPALHIQGDKNARYDHIMRAMAMAHEAGLSKIGFITEPEQAAAP